MHNRLSNLVLERVRQMRKDQGLTQEAFAEQARMSYKYFQSIESGRKRDIRLSTLERLAKAFDLEAADLISPDFSSAMVNESPAKVSYGSAKKPAKAVASGKKKK